MKEWWYANWRTLLEPIGVIAAALIGAAGGMIAGQKKREKKLKHKRYNINYRLAQAQEEQQNHPKALELYLQSAEDYKDDPDNPDRAAAFNRAGFICYRLMHYDKAIDCYTKAQAIYNAAPKANRVKLAEIYNNMAFVYDRQGDYDKALRLHNKVLAIYDKKKRLGMNSRSTATSTATTYNNIGSVYWEQGEYDEALAYYFKALVIREKELGKDHADTASCYNNIAVVYRKQGRFEKAFLFYSQALRIALDKLGSEHPNTKLYLKNLHKAYERSGLPEPFDTWLARQLAT